MFPVAMTFEVILVLRLRGYEIVRRGRHLIRGLGVVPDSAMNVFLDVSLIPVLVSQTLPPSQVSDSFNIAPVRRADNAQRVEK